MKIASAASGPGRSLRACRNIPVGPLILAALLLAGLLWVSPARADASLILDQHGEQIDPVAWMQVLDNTRGELTLEGVMGAASRWQPIDAETINLGIGHHNRWFRLPLENRSSEDREFVLEIPYAALDHISLHVMDGAETVAEYRMGSDYPFHERPVDHHYFLAPLSVPANSERTLYMNVRQDGAMRVPVQLWTPAAFLQHDQLRQLLMGFYFGGMLVIVLYNLFMYFGIGDRGYLLYVGFVLSLPMFIASLEGYTFQYVWPDAPDWNARSIGFFLTTTVLFGLLFTADFLQLWREEVHRFIRRGIPLMVAGVAAMMATVFFVPYFPMLVTVVSGAVLACLAALFIGVYGWYQLERWSRYYLFAWGALLVGGIVFAGSVTSILPANLFTENAVQIGSVLLVILLSLAMADRINEERIQRQQAQMRALDQEVNARKSRERALEAERGVKEELEHKVQERTRELEALNSKLEQLSALDQLTGLKNRRVLDETLAREFTRSYRFQHPLSLVMVDIDHFKPLNDNLGHPAGDECLRRMGEILRQSVPRESDFVARYGGEEFCILLPETDRQGAHIVAERIRRNVENFAFLVDGQHVPLTVSAGTATLQPLSPQNPEQLLELADKALYEAKHRGRNQVVQHDCPASLDTGSRA